MHKKEYPWFCSKRKTSIPSSKNLEKGLAKSILFEETKTVE
jgi:hypothetical protein